VELLQMLPREMHEEVLQMPADMQKQVLATLMDMTTAGNVSATRTENVEHDGPAEQVAGANLAGEEQVRWHGLLGDAAWKIPRVVAKSDQDARPGYQAYSATECLDHPEVLQAKAKLLAQMWQRSAAGTVVYTGAGLSTASGIGDYASKASNSVAPHKKNASCGSRLELKPTLAHHALAALEEKHLIGNWVQQNHDRLAQKAGFPQSKLNEIHGAWGDTKNQVKMMNDTLRLDLLQWLEDWGENATMCVALGTSLCGMNADQVPNGVAQRFAQSSGEGLVIIGLQRTAYDEVASLRIWGLCDDVMKHVTKELGLRLPNAKVAKRGVEWEHKHPRCIYNTPTRTARDPL